MLEGYKPIDFGNMFSSQGDLGQIRNRVGLSQAALNILSKSTFNSANITDLLGQGNSISATGEVSSPPRQKTLWGRVSDLLSTPSYAVAKAADSAIAGHQQSDTDSVLHDAMEIVGGVFSGAGRGAWAGLKGGFGDNAAATDDANKIYLGDALIRYDTHMSAQDALKPENLEKVRARLMDKKINQFSDDPKDKYFYNWDKGKVEVTNDDIQQYFKDMQKYGLGASIVSDPLNFADGSGIVKAVSGGSKGTAETFDASKLAKLNTSGPNTAKLSAFGKADGSYKVILPPGKIQNSIVGGVKVPSWFDFPANADAMTATSISPKAFESAKLLQQGLLRRGIDEPNRVIGVHLKTDFGMSDAQIQQVIDHLNAGTEPVAKSALPVANDIEPIDTIINRPATGEAAKNELIKSRESLFPVAEIPKDQVHAAAKYSDPTQITKLTGDLLRRMSSGDFANALDRIATKHPGVEFPRTTKLIQHISDNVPDFVQRLRIPAERKKIVGAFNRVIYADAQGMKIPQRIDSATKIINDTSQINPIGLQRLVEGAKNASLPVASKNPARDAKIVDDLVKQFGPQLRLEAVPAGIKDPGKYKAAMQKHGVYTGPKQVNVWNALTSKHLVNAKTPARFNKALNLLKHVESQFEGMGHIAMSATPKAGNSVPLKLSQVLEAIGPAAAAMNRTLLTKILAGDYSSLPAEVAQKIEELKAGEAVVDGQKMVNGINDISQNLDEYLKSGPLSAADTENIVTIGSKVASDITQAAGGSPVAKSKAAEYIKSNFLPKSPGDGFSITNTTAIMSHGEVSTRLYKNFSNVGKVNHDISQLLGITPKQAGKLVGPKAQVIEWLGARFNAAYKNPDMRPIYLREAATAKSTVALRAQYLNNLAKRFNVNDADLWNEALKGAQGLQTPLPGSQAEELSKEILAIMRNLFGSSGLKASVALENSVAGRAQLLMGELNKNLRRFGLGQYQFKKADAYAEGTKWLNSWESWDIQKPLEFLFKMQNVVEHTTREKLMFDDIISRFASPKKMGEFQHAVNHPRLQGYYFGKNAADQLGQFTKMLKEVSTPNSKSMQMFDKVLSKWKAGVTIYVPSHHIRNMIGDVYFNWLGGVNSARAYTTALNVMRSQHGRYEGLDAISQLTNPNALRRVIAGKGFTAAGKQTALTMKNGTNVTNDMVYVSAFQHGILPTTRVLEDIPDDAITGLDRFRPLGGKGQKFAHTISEGRDHYVRLAHFVNELKMSSKPFEQAVEDAAAAVRKWHPDGMDLTKFERNTMRRVMPFYSWTRKAFPLILESLVATPGKVMAYPKANLLLQQQLGIQTGPISDPFPSDQLFPDWIMEKGIGPQFGSAGNYGLINPSNPSMDIITQLNHPGTMAAGLLNPAIRIPMEGMTGVDSQTGAPVDVMSTDYISKQLPGISQVGRVTGQFGVSNTTKQASPNGVNMQNLANMLFGVGYQNTGQYQKSAQFDLRDYLKSQRKG